MKPYIYCEPFCGMAAVFYHLLGCKPPISYMGSKAGYAPVIADILGLSRHHRPAAVVLGDVGPTVAVHAGLFGASGVTARDVAGYCWMPVRSHQGGGGFRPQIMQRKGAALRNGPRGEISVSYASDTPAPEIESTLAPRAAEVAAIIRGWKDEEPRALWTRLKAEGWPSLLPPKGTRWGQPIVGRWLGPVAVEEVAAWTLTGSWCYKQGDHDSGGPILPGERRQDTSAVAVAVAVARIGEVRVPPLACYQGTASRLVEQLPERLDGWVTFCDPPYLGTTGYPFGGCGREEVLRIALDLHRRGATVAISEAVRLDRELGDGWYAVDISHARKGQARTFTKNQGSNKREPQEWVTVNRAPVNVPGKQQGLFL